MSAKINSLPNSLLSVHVIPLFVDFAWTANANAHLPPLVCWKSRNCSKTKIIYSLQSWRIPAGLIITVVITIFPCLIAFNQTQIMYMHFVILLYFTPINLELARGKIHPFCLISPRQISQGRYLIQISLTSAFRCFDNWCLHFIWSTSPRSHLHYLYVAANDQPFEPSCHVVRFTTENYLDHYVPPPLQSLRYYFAIDLFGCHSHHLTFMTWPIATI